MTPGALCSYFRHCKRSAKYFNLKLGCESIQLILESLICSIKPDDYKYTIFVSGKLEQIHSTCNKLSPYDHLKGSLFRSRMRHTNYYFYRK